jgi:hypothetical protein
VELLCLLITLLQHVYGIVLASYIRTGHQLEELGLGLLTRGWGTSAMAKVHLILCTRGCTIRRRRQLPGQPAAKVARA